MRRTTIPAWLAVLAVGSGCDAEEHPPRLAGSTEAAPDAGTELLVEDAGCQAAAELGRCPGDCGNLTVPLEQEPTNLYFVVDRSGSMAQPLEGGRYSKYEHARIAMAEVLRELGHRVRFGAAVFPGMAQDDDCAPGGEIFATRRGDYPECIPEGGEGPVLGELLTALAVVGTGAGTPAAATLRRVAPVLGALEGTTSLVLLTDGAPNCNAEASCSAADCALTVDGAVLGDGTVCSQAFNCCDPLNVTGGNLMCIDAQPTEALVAELAETGIRTFVVGMPGSEAYAEHLSRLAEQGGTARAGEPGYYPVTNTTELVSTLRAIVQELALSCDIALTTPAPDPAQVNVCFDGHVIAAGAADGWSWANESRSVIRINGLQCETLRSGSVQYLEVQYGCPTYVY